jgi:hypothetical protein
VRQRPFWQTLFCLDATIMTDRNEQCGVDLRIGSHLEHNSGLHIPVEAFFADFKLVWADR